MKKFYLKILFFIFPIIILLVGIELYFRFSQNAFAVKASYLKHNKDKIEVLVFGSSHSQNGINPAYFSKNTSNLSYGQQDIKIDSALFFHYIKQLPKVKKVVYELDYHRMDTENPKNFYKYPWYYIFYDIEIEKINWVNKISLYSSDVYFFNNILIEMITGKYKVQEINEFGYTEKNYSSEFEELHFDSLQIASTAKARLKGRHSEIAPIAFANNKKRILAIIDYCQKNNIELYFFATPLYSTYRASMLPAKQKRVNDFIDGLKKSKHIRFYDYSADKRFYLRDFANEDHLDPDGAKKYSMIIDSIINKD